MQPNDIATLSLAVLNLAKAAHEVAEIPNAPEPIIEQMKRVLATIQQA